jgi:hypothetical protein
VAFVDSESSQVKGLTKHRHCLEVRKSVACLSTPKRTSMINFKFSCTTKHDYSAVTQLFYGQTWTNYSEYGSEYKGAASTRNRWKLPAIDGGTPSKLRSSCGAQKGLAMSRVGSVQLLSIPQPGVFAPPASAV